MTSAFNINEDDNLFFTEVVKGKQTKHSGLSQNIASKYNGRYYNSLMSFIDRRGNFGYNCNQQGKTIRHFSGFRLDVATGSLEERNLFSVKDSVQRGGLTYYFYDEDDMKSTFYNIE